MNPTSQSDSLVLRPFLESDREAMLDLLNCASVKKTYMIPDFDAREDAIPLFERLMAFSRSDRHFARGIFLGGALIGFLNDCEIQNREIELGYVIAPEFQNRGYMTTALRAAIAELFRKGFNRVIAGHFEENLASRRVMEKAGMTPISKTEEIDYRGARHRCLFMAISKNC